ncbi:MAG: hypothetical protein AB7V46_00030 [Thermomicrobiales bacterium]
MPWHEIPEDFEAEDEAIDASDGSRVKIRENARQAMKELEESALMYKKLLACLKS